MSDERDAADASAGAAISRRGLLLGGGVGLGVGAVIGAVAASAAPATDTSSASTGTISASASAAPVTPLGVHQAGIDRPATPQKNAVVLVADFVSLPDRDGVIAALAALGSAIENVTETQDPAIVPDGAGDLTVTIGMGPRVVTVLDPALPGASALPAFASDVTLDADLSGGDILVAAYATDASILHAVVSHVIAAVPHERRWVQAGARGAGEGTIVRNPLGYHDGIIVPHGKAELAANVWLADGPAAGGTIAAIRRLRLDVARFRGEADDRQDAIVGRHRRDGSPLSGGVITDQVDLRAKTPEGEYVIPARSHARAAHPSFTGSALMLRRGYAYSNAVAGDAEPDDGLLFMCFQNDLDTFVRTQHRLDETDDLMAYAAVTASASFLIVPGRVGDDPLGHSLR